MLRSKSSNDENDVYPVIGRIPYKRYYPNVDVVIREYVYRKIFVLVSFEL